MLGTLKHIGKIVAIFRIQVQMLIEPILRDLSTNGRNTIVHDCGSFSTLEFAYTTGNVTSTYGLGRRVLAIEKF